MGGCSVISPSFLLVFGLVPKMRGKIAKILHLSDPKVPKGLSVSFFCVPQTTFALLCMPFYVSLLYVSVSIQYSAFL